MAAGRFRRKLDAGEALFGDPDERSVGLQTRDNSARDRQTFVEHKFEADAS